MTDNNHILLFFDTGYCEATLTPAMEKNMREVFDLEIEMLQGERVPLEDGRTLFKFTAADLRKRHMIAKLMENAAIMNNVNTRLN